MTRPQLVRRDNVYLQCLPAYLRKAVTSVAAPISRPNPLTYTTHMIQFGRTTLVRTPWGLLYLLYTYFYRHSDVRQRFSRRLSFIFFHWEIWSTPPVIFTGEGGGRKCVWSNFPIPGAVEPPAFRKGAWYLKSDCTISLPFDKGFITWHSVVGCTTNV